MLKHQVLKIDSVLTTTQTTLTLPRVTFLAIRCVHSLFFTPCRTTSALLTMLTQIYVGVPSPKIEDFSSLCDSFKEDFYKPRLSAIDGFLTIFYIGLSISVLIRFFKSGDGEASFLSFSILDSFTILNTATYLSRYSPSSICSNLFKDYSLIFSSPALNCCSSSLSISADNLY